MDHAQEHATAGYRVCTLCTTLIQLDHKTLPVQGRKVILRQSSALFISVCMCVSSCVCVCVSMCGVCAHNRGSELSGGEKLTPYYLSMVSSEFLFFFFLFRCPIHSLQFQIRLSSLLSFRRWEGRRRGVLMSKYESQGPRACR